MIKIFELRSFLSFKAPNLLPHIFCIRISIYMMNPRILRMFFSIRCINHGLILFRYIVKLLLLCKFRPLIFIWRTDRGGIFLATFIFLYFRESSINCDSEHIFDHSRQKNFQELTWFLNAWICVYFNEPNVEVFIKNEIVSKKLKTVFSLERIKLLSHCMHRFYNKFFYLRNEMFINFDPAIGILEIENLLKSLIAELITVLELSIVFRVFLYSIIC